MQQPSDQSVPISALQHWLYCPRQCALIHLERVWDENAHTASGRLLHDRAHNAANESRPGLRITRGLSLAAERLGIHGVADVVEFHEAGDDTPPEQCAALPSLLGLWWVFPVEYKRGRPKRNDCDRVQLCAQALCLEEMLNVHIPAGALFYGKTRRRQEVAFDASLRRRTLDTIAVVQTMFADQVTPPPANDSRCKRCSLAAQCLPDRVARARPVAAGYLARMLAEHLDGHNGGNIE